MNHDPPDDATGPGSSSRTSSASTVDRNERKDRFLVLDAHKNASVVFARALADQPVDITVGGWSRLAPGMLSRHVSGRFRHSNPYQHPDKFLAELTAHLERHDYVAVVPISDLSHVLLSKHKESLEATGTAVGAESWDTFVAANNKRRLVSLREGLSVPGPYTRTPDSPEEVAGMADDFSYPVVIKPQYTTVETGDGTYAEARISAENYVQRPENLASTYRSLVERYPFLASHPPIIQEAIPGSVVATCGVAEDGEFLACFQEERLRMYPVDGGSSATRQGIRDPEMADHARAVVDALEWTGPIYLEFIESPDGTANLLEVNGRYWGSVGCSVHSGVNVPLFHYRQLKGLDQEPNPGYRVGRQQRRLFYTDIRWLAAHLGSGDVGALWPFLKSFHEADHDLLSFRDPMPAAGAVFWGLRELIRGDGPTNPAAEETPVRDGGANAAAGQDREDASDVESTDDPTASTEGDTVHSLALWRWL